MRHIPQKRFINKLHAKKNIPKTDLSEERPLPNLYRRKSQRHLNHMGRSQYPSSNLMILSSASAQEILVAVVILLATR
jgi:hypothetical protein